MVDDELGDPKPGTRGQGSVSVGHEGLLFGEVNLEQFHSTAGGPPLSPRHNDESHFLDQPLGSVQLAVLEAPRSTFTPVGHNTGRVARPPLTGLPERKSPLVHRVGTRAVYCREYVQCQSHSRTLAAALARTTGIPASGPVALDATRHYDLSRLSKMSSSPSTSSHCSPTWTKWPRRTTASEGVLSGLIVARTRFTLGHNFASETKAAKTACA